MDKFKSFRNNSKYGKILSDSLLKTSCIPPWRRKYTIRVKYSFASDREISLPKALKKTLITLNDQSIRIRNKYTEGKIIYPKRKKDRSMYKMFKAMKGNSQMTIKEQELLKKQEKYGEQAKLMGASIKAWLDEIIFSNYLYERDGEETY